MQCLCTTSKLAINFFSAIVLKKTRLCYCQPMTGTSTDGPIYTGKLYRWLMSTNGLVAWQAVLYVGLVQVTTVSAWVVADAFSVGDTETPILFVCLDIYKGINCTDFYGSHLSLCITDMFSKLCNCFCIQWINCTVVSCRLLLIPVLLIIV